MGTDNAQANPRMILQNGQQARGPARIDFTKRFMGRHGQDESGLYLRNVGFGNRSWTGLVGRSWSPTEMTIAILEQNGGFAHVCHTPGMGTYIDWLITPDGKKIGNDTRGGLQFYVNRSLPFIVRDGKAVWLNADNPILMENDILEWKYDPYTQEMPDILGKKKGGGCMGGSNVTDLTDLRVRLFGGYDPSAERITMLPPLLDARGQAWSAAPQWDVFHPVLEYGRWDVAPAANISALKEIVVARGFELRSFWSKPAEIKVNQTRKEKPLPKQEREPVAATGPQKAELQVKQFVHVAETAGLNYDSRAEVSDAFVPRAAGIKVFHLRIHQAAFEGGSERISAGNEARAAAPGNFLAHEEPAPRTEQSASSLSWRVPRTKGVEKKGRLNLAEEKKECAREATEERGKGRRERGVERKRAPAGGKQERPKEKRGRKALDTGIVAKRERAKLVKAAAPNRVAARRGFGKTSPMVELKIIRLRKEEKKNRKREAPAKRAALPEKAKREAVERKTRAGRKKRPGKDRGVEYLLMHKAKERKKRNWLAVSKR